MSDPQPDLKSIVERLEAERPVPGAGFRGSLRASLLAGFREQPSPGGVRRLIAAYAASGALLLAVVAVGLAGLGPLAS